MKGFDCYEYTADDGFQNFYFFSNGPKGQIRKKVSFTSFVENSYFLSFGDLDPKTHSMNVKTISNNADTGKIFFTVAKIIYEFTKLFPEARIHFTGSTPSRTRLYQIMVNKHKRLIESVFEIPGWYGDEEETFIINRNYNYFCVLENH